MGQTSCLADIAITSSVRLITNPHRNGTNQASRSFRAGLGLYYSLKGVKSIKEGSCNNLVFVLLYCLAITPLRKHFNQRTRMYFGFGKHRNHPKEKNEMPPNGEGDGAFWLSLGKLSIIVLILYFLARLQGLVN